MHVRQLGIRTVSKYYFGIMLAALGQLAAEILVILEVPLLIRCGFLYFLMFSLIFMTIKQDHLHVSKRTVAWYQFRTKFGNKRPLKSEK